jgi:hypothetical protein
LKIVPAAAMPFTAFPDAPELGFKFCELPSLGPEFPAPADWAPEAAVLTELFEPPFALELFENCAANFPSATAVAEADAPATGGVTGEAAASPKDE